MNLTKYLLLFFVLLSGFSTYAAIDSDVKQPSNDGPLEVTVTLHINKIYNVNSVDETYQVDGYLVFSWQDDSLRLTQQDTVGQLRIYENDRARELMKNDIWVPAFELINIQGMQETQNIQIIVHPNGKVVFNERFLEYFIPKWTLSDSLLILKPLWFR